MLLIPLITAAAATTTLAAEFPNPVTQWTCAEFLSVDDEFKPTVVSWDLREGRSAGGGCDRYQGHRESDHADHRRMRQGARGLVLVESEDEWKKVEAETEAE